MSNIATHSAPVWQHVANCLVRVDLSRHGMPGRFEQLWARKLNGNKFEICCVPFFPYGMFLGDVVETDSEFTVSRVVQKSGHSAIRGAFADDATADKFHESVHDWLERSRLLYEWCNKGYFAADIQTGDTSSVEMDFLEKLAAEGKLSLEVIV